ncbi:MAG: cytochrome c biogenesis protein CcdA [Planctomycetota bacterium]
MPKVRLVAALVLALLAIPVLASPGQTAEDPPNLQQPAAVSAKLEEGGLIAGQKGTLVVTFTLSDERTRIQDRNLFWTVVPQTGVEVELDKRVRDPQPIRHETEWGDVEYFNTGTFHMRIPVRRLAEAPEEAAVVLQVEQIICYAEGCGAKLPAATIRVPLAKPTPARTARPMKANKPFVRRGGATVKVELLEEPSRVRVRFEPDWGHHIYLPPQGESGIPIGIGVRGGEGVKFGEVKIPEGGEVHDPVDVEIPVEVTEDAESFTVTPSWQACQDAGSCLSPDREDFVFLRAAEPAGAAGTSDGGQGTDAGAGGTVEQAAAEETPLGEIAFPVREGDAFEGGLESESLVQQKLREGGLLLTLLFVFLVGAGLTFTPCVFPIIPLVVATIAGGKSVTKGRLLALLAVYVLGLSLAFAAMGVVAAFTGASLSAAFESPLFIGGMALFFIVLAFGMLGLFELQPPQWLMRVQGSAQSRGGSYVGAFLLGGLGAVLASPCTGPVIVGMLTATAQSKDALLGFELFFTFGVGMGSVIALFGLANLALRPGPWMVWVRYIFGVLLFGGAMFYVANSALLPRTALWAAGIAVAVLSGLLLAWHVVKREREPMAIGAKRGVIVTAFYVGALALVMYLNRPVDGLPWIYIKDRPHLVAEVADAKAKGQPVLIDLWAQWCQKCKEYDHVMADDADLQKRLAGWKRLKIDLTDDSLRNDLRDAVGAKRGQQPWLAFIDKTGTLWKDAGAGWLGEATGGKSEHEVAADRLRERLERVGR